MQSTIPYCVMHMLACKVIERTFHIVEINNLNSLPSRDVMMFRVGADAQFGMQLCWCDGMLYEYLWIRGCVPVELIYGARYLLDIHNARPQVIIRPDLLTTVMVFRSSYLDYLGLLSPEQVD